jgi:hypothetical protein
LVASFARHAIVAQRAAPVHAQARLWVHVVQQAAYDSGCGCQPRAHACVTARCTTHALISTKHTAVMP